MKKNRKRKNPVDNHYIELLAGSFMYPSLHSISTSLVYYKQGFECKDCREIYYDCNCEKCDECHYNYCICNLDIEYTDFQSMKKYIVELAKKTLTKEQLEQLKEIILSKTKNPKQLRYFE